VEITLTRAPAAESKRSARALLYRFAESALSPRAA
jgi:hypothetical protein